MPIRPWSRPCISRRSHLAAGATTHRVNFVGKAGDWQPLWKATLLKASSFQGNLEPTWSSIRIRHRSIVVLLVRVSYVASLLPLLRGMSELVLEVSKGRGPLLRRSALRRKSAGGAPERWVWLFSWSNSSLSYSFIKSRMIRYGSIHDWARFVQKLKPLIKEHAGSKLRSFRDTTTQHLPETTNVCCERRFLHLIE